MKQKISAIAFAMGLLGFAASCMASEIVTDAFESKTLGQEVRFQIYLPDNYDTSSEAYPVVYMLHGAGNDESTWAARGGIQVTADALTQRGEMRPSVIVMPTLGPHSWYIDGNSDKAETAFIEDVIPYIEEKYNVKSGRADRSIAGLSMGGYGALNLSLSHPELFCAAGILSPAIYDPFPPATSAARTTPQFTKDGEFEEEAWTRFLYPARLASYKDANSIVPMWIESGDHDRFGIVLAAAKLYSALQDHQPNDIEYRVIDGDHEWYVYRDSVTRALPYMSKKCSEGS